MNSTNERIPPQPAEKSEKSSVGNHPKRMRLDHPCWPYVAALVLAVIFFLGLKYLSHAFSHETTDDAFIEGHIVSVSPKISGQVTAVYVQDNQTVRQNDLLVEIDPRDYDTKLNQKQASGETAAANLKTVLSVLQMMSARMGSAEAGARQAHAEVDAATATATRAQSELDRFTDLVKTHAVSQQEFENVQATAREAAANLKAAEQTAVQADSRVIEARAQLNASESAVELARAQIKQSDADVESAKLDVSYTKIFAPCDGRVTRKSVEVGNYLQIGQPLLALVPHDIWVVANFKETQLTHMRTNQPVDVEIESLEKSFRAHVESFQAGSGARFSLLPPENAVGNFVKVVQRVPVKIIFDEPPQSELVIGPGMSVVPTVKTGNEFPIWASALIAIIAAVGVVAIVNLIIARNRNHDSEG